VETIGNAGNIFLYIIGLVVFGFIYWLLDNILTIIIATNVADTTTFNCWALLLYVWAGIVIVYVIFGGIWLVKSFRTQTEAG
jgi:hypothetical protein